MFFWNKRLQKEHNAVDIESRVEVVAHKEATKNQIEETKRANAQLNRLLVENGFTLKIYLAAGGRHPSTHTERITTQVDDDPKKTWGRIK